MHDHLRVSVHDTAVGFRVNEALLTAAEHHARREGMTVSELLRHALRRELRHTAVETG